MGRQGPVWGGEWGVWASSDLIGGGEHIVEDNRWLGGPWRWGELRKGTKCWGDYRLVPSTRSAGPQVSASLGTGSQRGRNLGA